MRISELADKVGVPVSTVRYYERIGLLAEPARTGSGYREYDDDSATQLLFVTRARKLGLTCEQIVELLPIWGGTNCTLGARRGRQAHRRQEGRDRRPHQGAHRLRRAARLRAHDPRVLAASARLPDRPHVLRARQGPDGFVPLEGLTASLG